MLPPLMSPSLSSRCLQCLWKCWNIYLNVTPTPYCLRPISPEAHRKLAIKYSSLLLLLFLKIFDNWPCAPSSAHWFSELPMTVPACLGSWTCSILDTFLMVGSEVTDGSGSSNGSHKRYPCFLVYLDDKNLRIYSGCLARRPSSSHLTSKNSGIFCISKNFILISRTPACFCSAHVSNSFSRA